MATPIIVSIQVGLPRSLGQAGAESPHDQPWTSAFYKQPVAGPVRADRTQLAGDGQADLENHGGVDKAVLCYSADHYVDWQTRLNQPALPYGAFGENLSLADLDETGVCIGDQWQAGEVLLEVSQPRQPCWKLGRRWREAQLPAWVVENGRSGWYARVLREGMLEAGLELRLVARPHSAWTIARANDVKYRGRHDRQATAELAALPHLSAAWRASLEKRLATGSDE